MPSFYPPETIDLDGLTNPCSFRYELQTPWGLMAMVLSMDIAYNFTKPIAYPTLAFRLFSATIATAISSRVRVDTCWIVRWKASPLAFPFVPEQALRGRLSDRSAGKENCVLIHQDSGHNDALSKQLITLPATPVQWQSGGMLTNQGWDGAMTLAHSMRMGMAALEQGGDLEHLIAYPYIAEPTVENLSGVRFRRVRWLRVLQYTDKAPDWTGSLWP